MRFTLFLVAVGLAHAAPVTLSYRAHLLGFQEGMPAEVGDIVELSVTYESTAAGFPYTEGTLAYRVLAASGRVGDDVLIPDLSGTLNSYVIITNDYQDSDGSFMDQFMIQIGGTSASPLSFIALILRDYSSTPSSALESSALPLTGPAPSRFNDLAFFAVFYGPMEGGTDMPVLVGTQADQATPEPGSLFLCFPLLAVWCFCAFRRSRLRVHTERLAACRR